MLKSFTVGKMQYTVQSAIDKLHGTPRSGQRARVARGKLLDGKEYRLYLVNQTNRLYLELVTHSDWEA